jgi:hypothetical protein
MGHGPSRAELIAALRESRDRLHEMVAAWRMEDAGLCEYFGWHGSEHSDADCPQDDTCECPEHAKLRAASGPMSRAVELAERRIRKLDALLAELDKAKP